MCFCRYQWSKSRFLLFFFVFLLNPATGSDFKTIYKKEQMKCYRNPNNYLKTATTLMKCNVSFVGACWPEIPAGSTFIQPCPTLFFSVGGFIHRRCNTNGYWERMNFTQCRKLDENEAFKNGKQMACNLTNTTCLPSNNSLAAEMKRHYVTEGHVFVAFSWISVSVMLPSLIVLMVCKKDGNKFSLHKHLLLAFLMRTVTYFIDYYGDMTLSDSLRRVCTGVWVINRYFAMAEVTWMTNEAIFLLRLLIRTFDRESYYWQYFCFGWGIPALLIFTIYFPVSFLAYGGNDPRCWSVHGQEPLMMILYGPMTCMLVINLGITVFTLYTLVMKMRARNAPDLQIASKTTKGALILIPQMGVLYLIIFYTPRGNTAFDYFVRVVFPLQGTFAALVFVALNSEVRQAVQERWQQWCYQNNFTTVNRQRRSGSGSAQEMQIPGNLSLTRTTTLNQKQIIPGMPLRMALVNQSPILGLARDLSARTGPSVVEVIEIRQQPPPCQAQTTEIILHPQPSCSHQTHAKCAILSSNVKQSAQAMARPSSPRGRHSTESLNDGLQSNYLCVPTEAHPSQSFDSGIGELQTDEKRMSLKDQIFEEAIWLEDTHRSSHSATPRALYMKRKSCPAVSQSYRMTESMPLNIREAFKGYGICEEPKPLKKPRKVNRSASLFTDLEAGVQLATLSKRRIAWGDHEPGIKLKKLNKSCRKTNQLCPE